MKIHILLYLHLLSVCLSLQSSSVVGQDAPGLTTWAYLQFGDSSIHPIAGHNVSGTVRLYRQISPEISTNCLCDSSASENSRWCYLGEASNDPGSSQFTTVSIPERSQPLLCTLYPVVGKSYLYCNAFNNSKSCSVFMSPPLVYPNSSHSFSNTTPVCSLAYLSCYERNCLTWCVETEDTSTSSSTSTKANIEDGTSEDSDVPAVAVGVTIGGVVILIILISILACVSQHKQHKHHCHTFCKKRRFLYKRHHKKHCDIGHFKSIEEGEDNENRRAQPLNHTLSQSRLGTKTSATIKKCTLDERESTDLSLNKSQPQNKSVEDLKRFDKTNVLENALDINSCAETAERTQACTAPSYKDYLKYYYAWYCYQQMYLKNLCGHPNLSSNFAHQTFCQQQRQLNESRFKSYDDQDTVSAPQDQNQCGLWQLYFDHHQTASSHHDSNPEAASFEPASYSSNVGYTSPLQFPLDLPHSSEAYHNLRHNNPFYPPFQEINCFERPLPKQNNETLPFQPYSLHPNHNNYHPHHHHNHVSSSGHKLYYPSDHLHDHQNQLHHLHHTSHELLPETNHHHHHHPHQHRSLSSSDLGRWRLVSESDNSGGDQQGISRTNSAESLSEAGIFFTATPQPNSQAKFHLGPIDGDADGYEIKEEEEC